MSDFASMRLALATLEEQISFCVCLNIHLRAHLAEARDTSDMSHVHKALMVSQMLNGFMGLVSLEVQGKPIFPNREEVFGGYPAFAERLGIKAEFDDAFEKAFR